MQVAWAWEMLWMQGNLGVQEDDTCPEAMLGKQLQNSLYQGCLQRCCLQFVQDHALGRVRGAWYHPRPRGWAKLLLGAPGQGLFLQQTSHRTGCLPLKRVSQVEGPSPP